MADGASIILTANPKGVFMEGIISGTPKPGVVMQTSAGVAPVSGRFTYVVWGGSTGVQCLPIILLQDDLSGNNSTTAYVSGSRGFMYVPLKGEDMNLLCAQPSGTGHSTIGELWEVQTATGILIPQTSTNYVVAESQELLADSSSAPVLTWCKMWA